MTRLFLLFACALLPIALVTAQPLRVSAWSFDELTLKNGAKFQGQILSEAPDGIRFRSVSRPAGRPTVTLTSYFTRAEIAAVKRLSDADRKVLANRLAELDPSGAGEQVRMESLELIATDWPGKPGAAQQYDSDYFTLVSTGSEELTRRSAVRLEQVYAAFARILPPAQEGRPTRIMLATDRTEYRGLLGRVGEESLLNPAVYDPEGKRILCGHDLKVLGDELQKARIHHAQQLVALDRYEEKLRQLYRLPELERHLTPLTRERRRVWAAENANGAKFDQATARVFSVLYHEAFHAYVGTFVYPPLKPEEVKAGKGTGELPRWLNEGLAQVFETSVVEAGELRADTPNRDRLERVKARLKAKNDAGLLPLSDLLLSGRDAFLASHADDKTAAHRAYLSSWALAYYLTFQRHIIGTEAFQQYLTSVNTGGDPRKAFADLVGEDLLAFEQQWHSYLLRLRFDGSLAKP